MTATVLAFPGCTVDPAEVEARERMRAYLVARTPHPEWCDLGECLPVDTGDGALHGWVAGSVQGITVKVEQVDDRDGVRALPAVRVGDVDLLPSEVRDLIKVLWAAHDVAGGAR